MGQTGTAAITRWQDSASALLVALGLVFLLVPVPERALDVLLALQLGGAGWAVAAVVGARRPAALTRFPTWLLWSTLLRAALALAVTRQLLDDGSAGMLVEGMGSALTASGPLVGLVLWAALAGLHLLVLTRGAERVAQVSARFALDALPGRQLALESELRSGEAAAHEVRARRAELSRETGLLGALDGALRFLRGEAVALLSLSVLNLAGLALSVAVQGREALQPALETAVQQATGAAILMLVPALLTAAAAALFVTRVATPESAAASAEPDAPHSGLAFLGMAAALAVLAAAPGLPAVPLLIAAVPFLILGRRAHGRRSLAFGSPLPPGPPRLALRLHPAAAESLSPESPERVLERVAATFRREHGLPLAPIAVETDDTLPEGGYALQVSGATVARGVLAPDAEATPARQLEQQAIWAWQAAPGALLDPDTVFRRLKALEATAPALVASVHPRRMDLSSLTRLLEALLAEGLPIADLRAVLMAVSAAPDSPGGPTGEAARQATLRAARQGLRAQISQTVAPTGHLPALCLDTRADHLLTSAAGLPPEHAAELLESVTAALRVHPGAALLASPDARAAARKLLAGAHPGLRVISAEELLPTLQVTPVAVVGA